MRLLPITTILLLAVSLQAQRSEMTLEFSGVLSANQRFTLEQEYSQMMCTAMPELTILNCAADDRNDPPNNEPAGSINWRVEGGQNPVTCRLIADAGPIYTIVGGGGPGGNEYNSPRNFNVTNTTTSNTCIVMGGYTIEVTDALGCVKTCRINFVPTCFDYASSVTPSITDATCGNSDGCIDLGNIADAYCPDDPNAGNVSYSWSNGGANSPSICGLTPGMYSVTMTDFYGCQGVISDIEVGNVAGVMIDNCGTEMPTLIDGNDGQAYFNIDGGTPPFTINWTGQQNGSQPGSSGTNAINGLTEGNYTIVVTDDQGCTAMCEVFVEDPMCTFNASCPAAPNTDNSFTFNYSGGVAPYTISYTGPSNGSMTTNANSYTTPVLSTGDYVFTVQDANGTNCEVICNLSIFAPDCSTLVLDESQITNVDCAGSLSGAIDITLAGGYPNFTYSWSGPDAFTASTQDISGLAPGTYTLNVSDSESCELNDLTFTISEPDNLMINCSTTQSDFGLDNGTIQVNITGGTPPFSLDLNGTIFASYPSDSLITDLQPGTYPITITDANNCTQTCTVDIPEVQCDISYTVSTTNPSCPGAADGSIRLLIMDAAGDSTIIWSVMGNDGQTELSGLVAGSYTVTVGDTACTLPIEMIELVDPPQLSINIDQTATINCHGDSTASLSTTLTNGVSPFTYAWSEVAIGNEANPTNLAAGTYEVTVTDNNGCSAADTIVIDQPIDLVFGCAATNETASGLNDGTITLTSAGAEPMVISGDLDSSGIMNADAPIVLNNQSPGTYNFTLTDANGCTESCTVVVDPGGCIMTVALTTTQPDCANPNTGSILATVSNATAPVVFSWTPDQGDNDNPTNLPPGIYTLLATDALGCSATARDTIVAFTDFPALIVNQPDSICAASCIAFDLELTGTPPFSVSYELINTTTGATDFTGAINVNATNDTTINFCPADFPQPVQASLDNYQIRFTDLNDAICSSSLDIDITVNPFPLATDTIRQTYCADDIVTIDGQNFDQNTPNGEITLAGQSSNGCDSLVVVDLTFVDAVNGQVTQTLCPGAELVLEGNVFNEANPSGSFLSATASSLGCDSIVNVSLDFHLPAIENYNATICSTDTVRIGSSVFHANALSGTAVLPNASVNGCDSTVNVQLNLFAPAVGQLDTTICTTASLTIDGQTFDIDTPSGSIDYPAQSANGCDSVLMINLQFFDPATGSFDTTICTTEQYLFNGVIFDTENPTGDVVLNGASANGCDSTVTVTVHFFAPAIGTLDTTICTTDEFTFNGTTFNINNASADVLLSGASINGCDSTVIVNVNFFEPAIGTLETTICSTAQFIFNNEVFDINNPQGDVVLAGASANGCDSTVTVTVNFFPSALGTFDTTLCAGETFMYEGTLFGPDNSNGIVTLNEAAANGCDSIVTVNIAFRVPIEVELTSLQGDCSDDSFMLFFDYNGEGPLELTLSNTSQGNYTLAAGTNSLLVTPLNENAITLTNAIASQESCPITFGGSVIVPAPPTLSIDILSGDENNAISCNGGSDGHLRAVLNGDDINGYTFNWSNGANSAEITGLTAGNYSVTASNAAGCAVEATTILNEPLPLLLNASPFEGDCHGNQPGIVINTVDGGIGGPFLFRFDQGTFAPIDTLPVQLRHAPGRTLLEVQDINGCLVSAIFDLVDPPMGLLSISPNAPILPLGDSILLTLQTNLEPDSIVWVPEVSSIELPQRLGYFVSPTENTTYTVTVIDAEGCSVTSEVAVLVDRRVPVYIPTAFSPNGDGVNDIFTIFGDRGIVDFEDFRVLNRWGETMHEANGHLAKNDPSWAWDGRHRDINMNPGVYVYQVYANLADGRRELLKGEVILLK